MFTVNPECTSSTRKYHTKVRRRARVTSTPRMTVTQKGCRTRKENPSLLTALNDAVRRAVREGQEDDSVSLTRVQEMALAQSLAWSTQFVHLAADRPTLAETKTVLRQVHFAELHLAKITLGKLSLALVAVEVSRRCKKV